MGWLSHVVCGVLSLRRQECNERTVNPQFNFKKQHRVVVDAEVLKHITTGRIVFQVPGLFRLYGLVGSLGHIVGAQQGLSAIPVQTLCRAW